jgi:hypothetical protein
MHQGDRVRFRPGARAPVHRRVPPEATGTVLTCYRVLSRRKPPGQECVDVVLGANLILWGLQADELEVVAPAPKPRDS